MLRISLSDKTVHPTFFTEAGGGGAKDAYIAAEKDAAKDPNIAIALVSSTALGGIMEAYPNFFADSTEFLLRLSFLENVG